MNQRLQKTLRMLGMVVVTMTIQSCSDNPASSERNWELVWSDEFSGPAGQSPDSTKWDYDIGTNWGNNQLEYDTDRPENVSLDGQGRLAIVARKESYEGQPYTSARIVTRGKFEPTYGRIEARILLPIGQGIWPAFWMLGTNIGTVGWPDCGEVDIMEYRGQEPTVTHGSLHGPGYAGGNPITRPYVLPDGQFNQGFHDFAVEWGENYMEWLVDGNLFLVVRPKDVPGEWVFNQPFYLILNLAVGGNWVGPPNDQTVFPQTMLIDYVRVYRESK